jgi:hypothetical protein
LRRSPGPLSAFALVSQVLAEHGEYGSHQAERVKVGDEPTAARASTLEWLAQVRALFDKALAPQLHGRLVVIGLALLEPDLHSRLVENGFLDAVIGEIEPLDRVLTPSGHARLLMTQPETTHPSAALERLTPSAMAALAYAEALRDASDEDRVHMEHLILGLYQQADGPLRPLAERRGLRDDDLELALADAVGKSRFPRPSGPVPTIVPSPPRLSAHVEKALANAVWVADGIESEAISSGHLLVGALSVTGCKVVEALAHRGIVPQEVEGWEEPQSLTGEPTTGPTEPYRRAFPGFVGDEPSAHDHLGFENDVRSLCTLLVAKQVEPPISVGLFGDWGTGKSTFMRQMRAEIREIARQAAAAEEARKTDPSRPEPAFCSHVKQILFNAWSYADANLWAGLVTRIFEGLAEADPDERGDPRRQKEERERLEQERRQVLQNLETAELLQAEALEREVAANKRLVTAQEELESVNGQLAEKIADLRRVGADGPEVPDPAELIKEASKELKEAAGVPVAETIEGLRALEEHLRYSGTRLALAWQKAWEDKRQRRWIVGGVSAGAVMLAVGMVLLVAGQGSALAAFFASLLPVAAGAVAAVNKTLAAINLAASKAAKVVREAETARSRQERRQVEQFAREEAALRAEIDQLTAEQARRSDEVARAMTAVEQAKNELAEIQAGRRLYRFIEERATSPEYQRYLGLIALIRRDFKKLADLMLAAREDPPEAAPPAHDALPRIDRIVLYIDDLDRCPADRVVQVLEAVNLLLAFPLFVVVVGVDSRWLTRSLQRHYAVQLAPSVTGADHVKSLPASDSASLDDETAHWEATPQNYLEKIFQIPLTIPAMSGAGFTRLVSDLFPVRREEPAGDDSNTGIGSEASPPLTRPGAPTGTGPVSTDEGSEERSAGLEPTVTAGPEDTTGADVEATHLPPPAPALTRYERTIEMNPLSLELFPGELEFLSRLAPFIQTPRAAKRLANTYRLVRAGLDQGELARFVTEKGAGGEYRVALVLLAVLVGFPAMAGDFFEDLAGFSGSTWAEFLAGPQRDRAGPERSGGEGVGGRQPETAQEPGASSPHDGRSAPAGGPPASEEPSFEQLERRRLNRCLALVEDDGMPAAIEPYQRWARRVARYSFQTVRLAAGVASEQGPADRPARPAPAPPTGAR